MASFVDLQFWIVRTFGMRNAEIGVELLLESLDASVSRVAKAVRRDELGRAQAEIETARIISRTIAIAVVLELHPVQRLAAKYPGVCLYCRFEECQCGRKNPNPVVKAHSMLAPTARIEDYQTMLWDIYGFRNAQAGVKNVLLHLFEEIAEVRRARLREPHMTEVELCDVLAHGLGLASLLSINVEDAVKSRYEHGCPECSQTICSCPLDT